MLYTTGGLKLKKATMPPYRVELEFIKLFFFVSSFEELKSKLLTEGCWIEQISNDL